MMIMLTIIKRRSDHADDNKKKGTDGLNGVVPLTKTFSAHLRRHEIPESGRNAGQRLIISLLFRGTENRPAKL
jgi:hypothetical protein